MNISLEMFSSASYSGLPVNHNVCPYTLFVYPSAATRERMLTQGPVNYMFATLAIFAFTSILFLIYNYWVEYRQRQIMICAIRSSINASELDRIVQSRTESLQCTNEQLEYANNKIKKTSELQLEHFACMSHEIRTPLNGINGLSSIVRDDMNHLASLIDAEKFDPQTARNVITSSIEAMQIIVTSGELLRTIVDDVLDFAKLGSGKVEIDIKQNVALQEILDTVVASILSVELVRTKQLVIHTSYAYDVPPYITTDNRRLQQILYNLLGNAVKFSSEGGVIELQVHCIVDLRHGPCLRFTVKDYGKGIARDKFESIFEPFIQAEGSRTEIQHGGTGLGLAITSRLVKALDGAICVNSEVGLWTEFYVDLKLNQDIRKSLCDINSITEDNVVEPKPWREILQNTLLYLIDDNDRNREQMDLIFRHMNVPCKSCCSPEDVLNLIDTSASMSHTSHIGEGKTNSTASSGIILVRRDLYDCNKCSQHFLSKHDLQIILFASENEPVDDKSDGTIHSLTRLLPLVLMEKIAEYTHREDDTRTSLNQPKLTNMPATEVDIFNTSISGIRVLVAEDNKVNQKVLARILQRLNVEHVVIVDDGQQAVEREAIEQFDVILMDMHMPVLDGMDACHQIMARSVETNTLGYHLPKIVFLTALVSEVFKERCFAAGAFGFLSKPCSLERIKECLIKVARTKTNIQS
jgi:two-component system, sensor histidine kinase and response regulator